MTKQMQSWQSHSVKINRTEQIEFQGAVLVDVVALNHDDTVRRRFRLYRTDDEFVAERIDNPDTIDDRYWGGYCADESAIYDFFGNEPLANYLYGAAGICVPGLVTLLATTKIKQAPE